MSDIKLKPCPFCGGEAYYRTPTHLKGTAFDVMTVECKQCGASPYAVEVYDGGQYLISFDDVLEDIECLGAWANDVEIIGNIYDNPELMKGGNKND